MINVPINEELQVVQDYLVVTSVPSPVANLYYCDSHYSGSEAPSLGFGSSSSCSPQTCQCMRVRMRCVNLVHVGILWASCYVINTQPQGFGSRFARCQEGNFMSFGCFICASSPRFIQYTHTSLLLISKFNPESW